MRVIYVWELLRFFILVGGKCTSFFFWVHQNKRSNAVLLAYAGAPPRSGCLRPHPLPSGPLLPFPNSGASG